MQRIVFLRRLRNSHLDHSLLLRRFDEKESISSVQQLKSSVQKGIRTKILELYPSLDDHIDAILPKKENFKIVKWLASFSM